MNNLSPEKKDEIKKSTLVEKLGAIGCSGSKNACRALENLLNVPVRLTMPSIDLLTPETALSIIYSKDEEHYAVSQHLTGEINGGFCVVFSLDKALRIADLLLGRKPGETLKLSLLEESVLHEITNIIVGTFLTSIADEVNQMLLPTIPLKGLPPSLVSQLKEAHFSNDTFFFEVSMTVDDYDIDTNFIFITDSIGMDRIAGRSKEDNIK